VEAFFVSAVAAESLLSEQRRERKTSFLACGRKPFVASIRRVRRDEGAPIPAGSQNMKAG